MLFLVEVVILIVITTALMLRISGSNLLVILSIIYEFTVINLNRSRLRGLQA